MRFVNFDKSFLVMFLLLNLFFTINSLGFIIISIIRKLLLLEESAVRLEPLGFPLVIFSKPLESLLTLTVLLLLLLLLAAIVVVAIVALCL